MPAWIFIAAACLLLVPIVFWFLIQWLKARVNGVRIGFFTLVGMSLRRVNINVMVHSLILAERGGVKVPVDRLVALYRQGGNPVIVVMALVAADAARLTVTFDELADMSRRGEDVLAHVKTRAGSNPN